MYGAGSAVLWPRLNLNQDNPPSSKVSRLRKSNGLFHVKPRERALLVEVGQAEGWS
jgi:hypothetical protein